MRSLEAMSDARHFEQRVAAVVYAAERATFQTPFVQLGLVLEYGSSFTLPRLTSTSART